MKCRNCLILGIIFLVPLLVLTGWAQTNASRVDGVITDASGGVIQTARISLVNSETEFTEETITNESGLYVFPQVSPGNYTIRVEMKGFKTATVNDVRVNVDVPRTVDIRMEIGDLTENLVVTASLAGNVINTVNAELNTVIDREQILSLPLTSRNPLDFALMQSGVTGREETRQASVNGLRGTYQNLTLDGVNNQDNFIRTDSFFGVLPVRESFVEEFSLTIANSDVDAGIGAGQTKMVTRSGSNNFHGEAFYFHRNSALNANDFFNNAIGAPRDRVLNHQYGFNVGGPAIENKLFFFVNWEEERDRSSESVVRRVLTEQARTGNFTYLRNDTGALETVNLLNITATEPDSIVSNLIGSTPLPNDSTVGDGTNTGGFRFNSPGASTNKWLTFRIDYQPLRNHTLSAVLHQFRFNLPNDPFNGLDAPFPGLPGGGQKSTRYLGSLSLRSNLGATKINEIRFGAQSAPADFFTNERFQSGYQLVLPVVDNPVQNAMPQGRNAPVYDLGDDFSWIFGNHTLKLGGGIRWTSVDSYNDFGQIPIYTLDFGYGNLNPLDPSLFPGGIDGGDFSRASDQLALLGGYVSEASQTFNVRDRSSGFVNGYGEKRKYSQKFFSLYAGDTWRVNQKLSLNLGLRWEYHGRPAETRGLALLPENGEDDLFNPDAILNFAGSGTGRDFYDKDLNNFAPSIGIAWRPFDQKSTVVRAGYSISYVNDNNFTAADNAAAGNNGLTQQVTLAGIEGTVSGGGLVPIETPSFQVPRAIRDNLMLDPYAALFAIDRNFRTPYVQQWTFSLQHEISKDIALEVRYVGNHGVKLVRAIDVNQLMLPDEFVADFRRARTNLLNNGDPYVGEELTVIPQFGLAGGLDYVYDYLLTNEVGSYVGDFLAPNRSYFFDGEGGEDLGATLPITYFYRNPNAYVSDVLGNFSYSNYHALQAEIRKRYSAGYGFQVNYTFGKVLTDFGGSQTNFNSYMDNAQPQLEKMRADFDITHTLNANFTYDLPFGENRRYGVQNKLLKAAVGGWKVSGIVRMHSGEVINIVSQRATINRWGRSGKNTVDLLNMSVSSLKSKTGVYRDSEGRVLMFDPSLIAADGTASDAYFANPDLAAAGSLGLSPVSGPWYYNTDLSVRKYFDMPYREGARLELVASISNLFNRANFDVSETPDGVAPEVSVYNAQNINSTSFGLINKTFSPREIQFGLRLSF